MHKLITTRTQKRDKREDHLQGGTDTKYKPNNDEDLNLLLQSTGESYSVSNDSKDGLTQYLLDINTSNMCNLTDQEKKNNKKH